MLPSIQAESVLQAQLIDRALIVSFPIYVNLDLGSFLFNRTVSASTKKCFLLIQRDFIAYKFCLKFSGL